MYATLTAAALTLAAAQPPGIAPGGTAPAAQPQPAAHPVDGNWTIICLEKNGRPVEDARNLTVSIQKNTITFNKAGGSPSDVKAMRVEFGPKGTVRVTEADADNKFTPAGDTPPATGSGVAKAGVYVLTQDYLAVCVHDQPAGAAATEIRPGGGTTTDQPRVGNAGQAQARSYCTVILRRAEGGRPAPAAE